MKYIVIAAALAIAAACCVDGSALAQNHEQSRSTTILQKYKPHPQQYRRGNGPNLLGEQYEQTDQRQSTQKTALFFAQLAVIGLALAGFAVVISYRLFSPHGLFNRMAKDDYIPSQYKSQHRKFLAEFSRAATKGGLPLGVRPEGIRAKVAPAPLAVPKEVREENPHVLLLGASSKGKTRLMANFIRHDVLTADRAVVVVDSEGGLIDLVLQELLARDDANQFAKRIVILDPARRSGLVRAYDPLKLAAYQDPQIVANNVVMGFKAIYQEGPNRNQQDQWNAQTANILRNAVMLLMATGHNLSHLPFLLSENDFRDVLLDKLEKTAQPNTQASVLLDAWAQYRRLARTDQWISWVEPILNRVQPVLADVRIRQALTSGDENIDLEDVIAKKKILLVRLPQGQLDPSANLLGSLIITGIRQAAISLAMSEIGGAAPCAIYADELNDFIDAETLACISAESRRYQVGVTGTLRTMQTLPEAYRTQLVNSVGLICTFALARKDAEMLGPQMFRVDGRKYKWRPMAHWFNPLNTSAPFEQVIDEEKLNIDRLVGLDKQHYFCYQIGSTAGVLKLRAHEFADVKREAVNRKWLDRLYHGRGPDTTTTTQSGPPVEFALSER